MERPALIFDLDGTLWDARSPIAEIWTIVGRKYLGNSFYLTAHDVTRFMGMPMQKIVEEVAPMIPEGEVKDCFTAEFLSSEVLYLSVHPGRLYDGVKETLESLAEKGYPLFICSNAQSGYIENFLRLMPEGLILGHKCWGDTKQDKHVTIKALMDEYGIEDAIYIGDTEGDERESRLAGLSFCHASYGFGKANNPDFSISNFAELPKALIDFANKEVMARFASELEAKEHTVAEYLSPAQIAVIKDKLSSSSPEGPASSDIIHLIDGFLKENGTVTEEYKALKNLVMEATKLRSSSYAFPETIKNHIPLMESFLYYDIFVLVGVISLEEISEMERNAKMMLGGGSAPTGNLA